MLIRIEASDLPGRSFGPGPDDPAGRHNVHVAVQGRKGVRPSWSASRPATLDRLAGSLRARSSVPHPGGDVRGALIHGSPGRRFIYLSWGVIDAVGSFTMFRRAKLWLNAVPDEVMRAAMDGDVLVGRLGLTDSQGWPLCASVRPPQIEWSAAKPTV